MIVADHTGIGNILLAVQFSERFQLTSARNFIVAGCLIVVVQISQIFRFDFLGDLVGERRWLSRSRRVLTARRRDGAVLCG